MAHLFLPLPAIRCFHVPFAVYTLSYWCLQEPFLGDRAKAYERAVEVYYNDIHKHGAISMNPCW